MTKYTLPDELPPLVLEELETYSPILQALLFERGISTQETAKTFLNPDYSVEVHDPFLMKGMDIAVKRVLQAVENKEKIVIYSDFDADGIPGGALLHDFFKKIGYENFENYIPHRDTEGYGFHKEAVEKFAKNGANLIITVDVGINARAATETANELGIDVIITDHHEPIGDAPKALCILDPKQKGETYPFQELCGTGVAYKLVQACLQKARTEKKTYMKDIKEGWEKWLLDLVAIATVADMVPLVGENRVLAYWGMYVLRRTQRVGLQVLCKKLGVKQHLITQDDIGFMIGPRINAASRMGKPEDAFKLLVADDPQEADMLAKHLNTINNQRKGVVSGIVKKLKAKFDAMDELPEVLVAGNPEWNPALLGLAANSLVNTYNRPACIWGREGTGVLKGSCRSDGSITVIDLLVGAKEKLIEFGGHKGAGGFSVEHDNVHYLQDIFIDSYKNGVNKDHENILKVSQIVLPEQVNITTHNDITLLQPFGIGNEKPVFLLERMVIERMRIFGKEQNHIEIFIKSKNNQYSPQIRAYSFFATASSYNTPVEVGEVVDVFATIEKSLWGAVKIEMRIIDIV